MSILTKEVIQKILNDDWLLMDDCEGLENCTVIKELARIALAAIDSEPVAWLLSGGGAKNVVCFDSGNAYADPLREVTPLYRHAQPAPVVPDDVQNRWTDFEDQSYYADMFTHWMPLPAGPKEEK